MKPLSEVVSDVLGGCESFCFNFMRGISENIKLIRELIHEEQRAQPKSPPSKQPPTELARRRAELRKKQGVQEDEQAPRAVDRTSGRAYLFKLMAWNFFYCMLLLVGMNQVLVPPINWLFRDLLSRNERSWLLVSWILTVSWKTPILAMLKISNIFWLNDLAKQSYKESMGKPVLSSFTFWASDFVYSLIFQGVFFIQVILCAWVPVRVGHINVLELIVTNIMYSLYAFEYKWTYMGYTAQKRMDLIDKNFAYFFGFSFPITFLVVYCNEFWIGIVLSSLFFPALVLCAINASEPREARGWSTMVFYPAQRVLVVLFWTGRKLGLATAGKCMLVLLVGTLLLWLGLFARLLACVPDTLVTFLTGAGSSGGEEGGVEGSGSLS